MNKTLSLIEESSLLLQNSGVSKALDHLYQGIDSLLWGGEFEDIDSALGSLDSSKMHIHMAIGLLTTTLVAKSKFTNRESFFNSYRDFISKHRDDTDRLLYGLQ